jgi:long-subunit acyl-CoA synthetase (AMP-forming)
LPSRNTRTATGNFERFTAREINDLAHIAAALFIRQGLTQLSKQKAVTVTLLGQGSVQYVATFLAFAKLRYTAFLMSPRPSAATVAVLLERTECGLVIFTENMKRKVGEVQALWDITVLPMVIRAELDFDGVVFQASNYDTASWLRSSKADLTWHSSGSNGDTENLPANPEGHHGAAAFGGQCCVFWELALHHVVGLQFCREYVCFNRTLQLRDHLLLQ